MNTALPATLTILSALFATLGSLFLAYDYLSDLDHPQKNPLRLFLLFLISTITGMIPGIALLLVLELAHVKSLQLLDIAISAIVLGALVGIFSAWYARGKVEGQPVAARMIKAHYAQEVRQQAGLILTRATVALVLGVGIDVFANLLAQTTLDNALTSAAGIGCIGMAVLGVWPLINWTPISRRAPDWQFRDTAGLRRVRVLLPGLGLLCLYIGIVDGLFDSRVLQTLSVCVSTQRECTSVLTLPAAGGIAGTVLTHTVIFLVGGIIACFIWIGLQYGLIHAWDDVFVRTRASRLVFGGLLSGASVGVVAVSVIAMLGDAIPNVIGRYLWIPPLIIASVVATCFGFFLPLRSIQVSVEESRPFSRFDAVMMAVFALCILLPYIGLTNTSNLAASLLHFPHALSPQAVPPIQLQRIVYFSRICIVLGIPVAFSVGGLTRAIYRWTMTFPHKALGAIGIGLTLVAFLLQLIPPTVILFSQ